MALTLCPRCRKEVDNVHIIEVTHTDQILPDRQRRHIWLSNTVYEWTGKDTCIPTSQSVRITKDMLPELIQAIRDVFPDFDLSSRAGRPDR